jgi:phage protein D
MIGIAQITLGMGSDAAWSSYKIGDPVEVKVGGSSTKIFVGVITEFRFVWRHGVRTFSIVAMDPLCKLAASRQTKTWENVKDSDVASSVISEGGCTAGVVDSTNDTNKWVFLRNESYLFFLKRLAAKNGFVLLANEGKVDFKKASFSDNPVEVTRDDVVLLDFNWATQVVPPDLTVYGWDYVAKEKVEGTGSSGDITTIGGGKNAVSETGTIWQKSSYVSDVMVSSQTGAKDMAVGEINRHARNAVRGRAIVQGNGSLHAGVKVTFSEMGTGLNPEAYVLSSRHTVDENGFVTEIHFCSNTFPV